MFRGFAPCSAPAIKTNKLFASRSAKSFRFNRVITRPPMLPMLHPSLRASHMLWSLTRMPLLWHMPSLPAEQASSLTRNLISFIFCPFSNGKPDPSCVSRCRFIACSGPPRHSCAWPRSIGTTSCCCVSWSAAASQTKISFGGGGTMGHLSQRWVDAFGPNPVKVKIAGKSMLIPTAS